MNLSPAERVAADRVAAARVARLATVTSDGAAHAVPICFAFDGDTIVSVIDGKAKSTTALRRLANIAANPRVSLLVDHYDDDWTQLWWVRVDAIATEVPKQTDRERALDALATKYSQYRDTRPDGAVIALEPTTWRFWENRPRT